MGGDYFPRTPGVPLALLTSWMSFFYTSVRRGIRLLQPLFGRPYPEHVDHLTGRSRRSRCFGGSGTTSTPAAGLPPHLIHVHRGLRISERAPAGLFSLDSNMAPPRDTGRAPRRSPPRSVIPPVALSHHSRCFRSHVGKLCKESSLDNKILPAATTRGGGGGHPPARKCRSGSGPAASHRTGQYKGAQGQSAAGQGGSSTKA